MLVCVCVVFFSYVFVSFYCCPYCFFLGGGGVFDWVRAGVQVYMCMPTHLYVQVCVCVCVVCVCVCVCGRKGVLVWMEKKVGIGYIWIWGKGCALAAKYKIIC